MIENMKVEFGRASDIDSWMQLVRKVSWNFPGLETEQSIDKHKIIVLKFMNDKRALCVKNEQDIVGVLLYSRKHNMICCLAVDPAYRKRGIASLLLREALDELDRDKDITVSTFRENDDKDSKKSKDSESSFIDKAKDAVNSVKNTLSVTADSVKNMVNKFIDGLAVLIVTTCLIPVLVIVFFIWLVKLVLGSAISSPGAVAMRRGKDK